MSNTPGTTTATDGETGQAPATPDAATPNTDAPAPQQNTPQETPAGNEGADKDDAGADDARVKRANQEAARYRTERNELREQLEQQGEILKRLAAVFNPEGEQADTPDPAALTAEVETVRTENKRLQAELLVHTLAGEHNANPAALLDSRSFADRLHGLDPAADDYRDQVAKAIEDAVTRNANLRAAGQGPARGGAPGAGQGPATPDGAITKEQFDAMGYAERADLYRANPGLYRRLAGTAT